MMERKLLGKVIIKGSLECLTGLHIGASRENMEIGGIDSPVVKDPITREPYIPGSSLKGKLRALLEKALSTTESSILEKRDIGTRHNPIEIHVCDDADSAYNCQLCRIFGSTGKNGGKNFPARLIVRDLSLKTESREMLSEIDTGLQYTEWKFENAIDRVTSAANPRQLERVPKGAEFEFEMVYNVEEPSHIDPDLKNIDTAIQILMLDALGGHGSRGYGKVRITYDYICAETVKYIRGENDKECVEVESPENVSRVISQIVALFNPKE